VIRRETTRHVNIVDDLGLRFAKPYSRSDAQFRPTHVEESLVQTDQGAAHYSVKISGPVQTKTGRDSQSSGGSVIYGQGFGKDGKVSDIPSRLRGYLVGPERLAKVIALPKDGAR
jgi:hypothetical protein